MTFFSMRESIVVNMNNFHEYFHMNFYIWEEAETHQCLILVIFHTNFALFEFWFKILFISGLKIVRYCRLVNNLIQLK